MWWGLLSTCALGAETSIVPAGASWRYLDGGVAPADDWTSPGYDDAAWSVGAAPLGYGIVGVVTTVGSGPDLANRYVTTWFRHAFRVDDPADVEAWSIHLRRDDGAVVYVNGVEVMRENLPALVTPTTLATRAVYGVDQDLFAARVLDPVSLVAGDNVVAVELHQQSVASSDLVMDLALSAWDGPSAVTRGPWLQQLTPEGAIVRWRTDGPSIGRLSWGLAPGALAQSVDDELIAFDHEITIEGMRQSTEVAYAVGSPAGILAGGDVDHVFRTAPIPGVARPVRIWVLGDSGTANADAADVRDAYVALAPDPLDTDVWLMLGDNAYNNGRESEYQTAVFDFYPEFLRQVPLWSALGNHDGYSAFSDTQTGPYFDLFSFPTAGESGGVPSGTEAYYSFDYANVHFVSLDSTHSDRSPGGAMASWLLSDLAAVEADWIIAFWHHPPYSRGSHDSDFEDELVEMRETFLPILEDNGVDLLLAGHSHSYERSWLIDGHYDISETFDPLTMRRQDHDGRRAGGGPYTKWSSAQEPHQGAVYIVAGSSGQTSGGALDHPAMFVSLNALGSVVLDVDDLSLDARFLDETGTVVDQFAIDKGRTTIVDIDGPRLGMEDEVLAFSGLARQPDGSEPPIYVWDWGDGTADTTANPTSHAWTTEGAYTATLTVTDDDGEQASDSFRVDIDDAPPIIDQLEVTPGATEGSPVTFTGNATDAAGDLLGYRWTIDGDVYETAVVTYTFSDDGMFEATLVVTDDAGRVDTGTLFVPVGNLPPVVDDVTVTDASEASDTTLVAQVEDPGWFDVLSYRWTLPDGTIVTGPALSVSFPDDGIYPILLAVDDGDGGSVEEIVDLSIANLRPSVTGPSFDGVLQEGGVVAFHATASDPGPLDTTTVSWSFEPDGPWVDGEAVNHVFPDQGPWSVRIAAVDDDGGSSFVALDVTLDNLPPTFIGSAIPHEVDEGIEASWAVSVADPGTDDLLSVLWTFSDGATVPGTHVVHTFLTEGTGGGVVEVVDDEGAGESLDFVVRIDNAAPVFRSVPGLRTAPGERWVYAPEVFDVDPLRFRLVDAPEGTTVDRDGRVVWHAPVTIGTIGTFGLSATDDDGAESLQQWSVVVSDEAPIPEASTRTDALACGCATGRPSLGGALLLLVGLRRRRITSRRAPGAAP